MSRSLPVGRFSRREFLKNSGAAVAGTFICSGQQLKAATSQAPNVLIILSDQESEVFENQIPRTLLRLPNRNDLAQHGIRLTHAFVSAPQCSASRSTLWTGLYPHQAGVVTNVDRTSLGRRLSPVIPTIGKVFRDHGYTTAYLGKWHLTNGLAGGLDPADDSKALQDFGFDHYHFASDSRAHHNQLAEDAATWIREAPPTPWLLVVSFPFSPHDITSVAGLMSTLTAIPGISLPPNFEDNVSGQPAGEKFFLEHQQGKVSLHWGKEEWLRYRSYYLSLIERIDGYLGIILEPLRSRADADRTVIVYTSDHGDMAGAHRLPFKGPFMYDELLRVPLLISWPQRFRQPVVSDSMVSNVDLAPTLAGIAGIEWPTSLPGRDFSLLFDYPDETIRAAIFAEYYGKQHFVYPIRTIRTVNWKYNLYVEPGRDVTTELYDLRKDPGELHNLADDDQYRNVRQALSDNLFQWRRRTMDPLL